MGAGCSPHLGRCGGGRASAKAGVADIDMTMTSTSRSHET
ncbi:Hypothetical protein A7982_06588 [Minicystis rosea]|nr:Hypothetical protein A7982_06588 [Minicystis rosea]